MYSLIYSSKAIDTFGSDQIYEMLNLSRTYNFKNEITGCLLFHQRKFIQLLEGSESNIHKLYQKILNDKRHEAVSLLREERSDHRIFSDWSMAFYEFDPSNEGTFYKQSLLDTYFNNSNLYKQSSKTGLLFFKSVRDLLRN